MDKPQSSYNFFGQKHGILEIDDRNEAALTSLMELRRDMGMGPEAIRLARALCRVNPENGAQPLMEMLIEEDDIRGATEVLEMPGISATLATALKALITPTGKSESEAADETASMTLGHIEDADVIDMLELFSGRPGVHARQWRAPDGRTGYSPVHRPLNASVLRQHFCGEATIGVYPVRPDNQVLFMALDVDVRLTDPDAVEAESGSLRRAREYALRVQMEAGRNGLVPLMEWSGSKGYHLWFFFDEPWPAHKARTLARFLLDCGGEPPDGIHTDIFPAQASVKAGGLGNLIKLPLGVHLRSGRRSRIMDETGAFDDEPFGRIRNIRRIPLEMLESLYSDIRSRDGDRTGNRGAVTPAGTVSGDSDDVAAIPETSAEAVHSRAQNIAESEYRIADDEELAFLCAGCSVIASIVNRCLQGEVMTHDEQAVLIYTVGHLSCGPSAVNLLLEKNAEGFIRLKGRLRGHPTSCRKIRQRLGLLLGENGCVCPFDTTLGAYPHPLLHLAPLRALREGQTPVRPTADSPKMAVPLFPGVPGGGQIPEA
jgi:hypothetical protein